MTYTPLDASWSDGETYNGAFFSSLVARLNLIGADLDALTAAMTTALGDKQPADTDLTAIAALTSANNKMLYATGPGTWALADLTPFVRTVLDDPDALTMLTNLSGYTSTPTAAGTTTLTAAATQVQVFTGTLTETVRMPTTSVPRGAKWVIINVSSATVSVQSSNGELIVALPSGTSSTLYAQIATPTTAANWISVTPTGGSGGAGAVDNGDGTITLTGGTVVDNGDGTVTV